MIGPKALLDVGLARRPFGGAELTRVLSVVEDGVHVGVPVGRGIQIDQEADGANGVFIRHMVPLRFGPRGGSGLRFCHHGFLQKPD